MSPAMRPRRRIAARWCASPSELSEPLSRDEPSAHFTASAFVIDEAGVRTCLVEHAKLGRLLQPGGHVEPDDVSLEAAAIREAREETALEVELHPTAPRPFDVDVHEIPDRPGEPAHFHLDVRYLLVGRGEPGAGAAWHAIGKAGDGRSTGSPRRPWRSARRGGSRARARSPAVIRAGR